MSKNKAFNAVDKKSPSSPTSVTNITIDDIVYDLAELSDSAKRQIGNVRLVDQELAHLQRQRAIASVARTAYAQAVAAELPKEVTAPKDGGRRAVINGVAHDWASLGDRVQGLIAGIRAADQELARINAQEQLAQTARGAFSVAIKRSLPIRVPQNAETTG